MESEASMIFAGNTLTEAKRFAEKLSSEKPGKYITISACFGIYASIMDRLHVNSPTDSCCISYWLNGVEKPFTDAQRIADQNATPEMS